MPSNKDKVVVPGIGDHCVAGNRIGAGKLPPHPVPKYLSVCHPLSMVYTDGNYETKQAPVQAVDDERGGFGDSFQPQPRARMDRKRMGWGWCWSLPPISAIFHDTITGGCPALPAPI
jgi:hypothetical protein